MHPTLFFPILKLRSLFNRLFSELWKFSNVRRSLVAFVLNNSHRKQGQIVQSLPAFLRVFFLEFRALARILFLADLAFLSLNLGQIGETLLQATFQEKWVQVPIKVSEASPLGLNSHPLGPGGVCPGLVNLKHQSAFFRKAWKEGSVHRNSVNNHNLC